MSWRGGFDWTPEAEDALRALMRAGHLGSECARTLSARFGQDISRSAVVGKAWRIGEPWPRREGRERGAGGGPAAAALAADSYRARGAAEVALARRNSGRREDPGRAERCQSSAAPVRPAAGTAETPRDGGPREAAGEEVPPVGALAPAAPPRVLDRYDADEGCRWPLGQDPVSGLWRFCNAPREPSVVLGRPCPYCTEHRSIAVVKVPRAAAARETA